MSDKQLPPSGNPDGIFCLPGWVWDQLVSLVRGGRIEVGAGLAVTRTESGTFIRLASVPSVQQLKITGNETGGGFYKGRTIIGSPTPASGSTTLSMPLTGETVANVDDSLIIYLAENGVSSHLLPNPSYGVGLLIGVTRESTPRKVFVWLSGGPFGAFPCTCVTNSATAAGDYGDSSNRATLKYDITPYGGAATVGANLAPKGTPGRVVKNKVAAGSDGSYAYNGTAVVLLTVYNEYAADQENCPAP